MTQQLIEPFRFSLPAEWGASASRRGASRRREWPGRPMAFTGAARALSLSAGVLTLLAGVVFVTPAHAQASDGPAGVAADLRMAQDAQPMRAAADAFVAHAMAGERDAVLALLSPSLVARMGPQAAARVLDAQILPFFQRGREVGRSTTVTRTTDAQGAHGFAFYQWLEPRDGGQARPFTLYVVREQDRLVVANVVPDRLVAGRHR